VRSITNSKGPFSYRTFLLFPAMLSAFVVGCGGLTPVEGKAFLDGKPLTFGLVMLVPNREKGNQTPFRPSGGIGADGTYRIASERGNGAPNGSYKVVVIPLIVPGKEVPASIPAIYQTEAKSDLQIEVTATPAPGAYDLNLKSPK